MEQPLGDRILRLCREILAPLVLADGGELFLVEASSDIVHLHLSGACSGCPGVAFTRDRVVAPVVHAALPKVHLVITTGLHPPDGSTKIDPLPSSA